MKRPGPWIVAAFAAAFSALLLYSTLGARKYRVEVCIEFEGRSACRIASAASGENALRTATDNACAFLAAGMSESRQCEITPPKKVRWLEGK